MIEDWTREEIDEALESIKKEVRLLNGMGKKSFVFVYCAGHGMIDHVSKQQFFLLNSTNNNLFGVEQACVDICAASLNACTVFAIYDICQD